MSEGSYKQELYPSLIASLTNKILKEDLGSKKIATIKITDFLEKLNELLHSYNTKFDRESKDTIISQSTLLGILNETEFKKIISMDGPNLNIEPIPFVYESIITETILSSSWEYSQALIKIINNLSAKYVQNFEGLGDKLKAKQPISHNTSDNAQTIKNKEHNDFHEDIKEIPIHNDSFEKSKVKDTHEDSMINNSSEERDIIQTQLVKADEQSESISNNENTVPDAERKKSTKDLSGDKTEDHSLNKQVLDLGSELEEPEESGTKPNTASKEMELDTEMDLEQKSRVNPEVEDTNNEEPSPEAEPTSKLDDLNDGQSDIEEESEASEGNKEAGTTDLAIDTNEIVVEDDIHTGKSLRKRSHSPSSANPQQRKRFQHIAINLINSIHAHRYSSPFLHPVHKKEALDYADIIYEPKDLKNILRGIKSKADPPEYQTIRELERDIMLMFANCIMYNRSDTDLVELTKSMKDDVSHSFKIFEEAESGLQ